MSADVYLDPVTGDLPSSFRFATQTELILQRVRIRIETFFGEVLLDQRAGLPYLRWRETKRPPLAEVLSLIRREVESVPGVLRTSDPSIGIEDRGDRGEGIVCIRMTVAIPDEDSMRVRIDLFGAGLGSTETRGFDATNLTGRDPVDPNTSPMPVVEIVAGTLA